MKNKIRKILKILLSPLCLIVWGLINTFFIIEEFFFEDKDDIQKGFFLEDKDDTLNKDK